MLKEHFPEDESGTEDLTVFLQMLKEHFPEDELGLGNDILL